MPQGLWPGDSWLPEEGANPWGVGGGGCGPSQGQSRRWFQKHKWKFQNYAHQLKIPSSTNFVLGTVARRPQSLFHLTLPASLQGQRDYGLHFAGERTEAQRGHGTQKHRVGKQSWDSRPGLLRREEADSQDRGRTGQLCEEVRDSCVCFLCDK